MRWCKLRYRIAIERWAGSRLARALDEALDIRIVLSNRIEESARRKLIAFEKSLLCFRCCDAGNMHDRFNILHGTLERFRLREHSVHDLDRFTLQPTMARGRTNERADVVARLDDAIGKVRANTSEGTRDRDLHGRPECRGARVCTRSSWLARRCVATRLLVISVASIGGCSSSDYR